MSLILFATGGLLLLATVLPLVPSDERFIRAWDFPRAQIAGLIILVLIASAFFSGFARQTLLLWYLPLLLALSYQLYRILPYTPLYPVEMKGVAGCLPENQIRLLVANVLQSNRKAGPLLDLVAEDDPDLILLLEIDSWWEDQLHPLDHAYPYAVRRPQDDGYGLLLYSRLPLVEPHLRFLFDDYVPSVRAGVRLLSGTVIEFHGVHPKPPPRHDTALRDAELMIVGREVRARRRPAIVAGDLNDVAWSDTTRQFQIISRLLDPRTGRGLYSTFNANWPLLRWPLDHVFAANTFVLVELRRLGHIGSDHFPFFAVLCHHPAATDQPVPEATPMDVRRAREIINKGRKEADGQK